MAIMNSTPSQKYIKIKNSEVFLGGEGGEVTCDYGKSSDFHTLHNVKSFFDFQAATFSPYRTENVKRLLDRSLIHFTAEGVHCISHDN